MEGRGTKRPLQQPTEQPSKMRHKLRYGDLPSELIWATADYLLYDELTSLALVDEEHAAVVADLKERRRARLRKELCQAYSGIDTCLEDLWFNAALEARHDELRILLRYVPVDIRNLEGKTALLLALEGYTRKEDPNRDATVNLLLNAGASLNLADYSRNSPLLVAVHSAPPHIIQLLLEKGANVNDRNLAGDTALVIASTGIFPNVALVEMLVEHNADVNAANLDRKTPLLAASETLRKSQLPQHTPQEKANLELFALGVIELLLDRGADTNAQLKNGDTLLMNFVYSPADRKQEYYRILQKILSTADVDAQNTDGFSALFKAILARDLTNVEYLIAAGADPNMRDADGYTPLMLASATGSIPIINTLLKRGAKVNLRTKDGTTALLRSQCFPDVVQVLLDAGADPNITNKLGQTLLYAAIREPDVASILLKHPDIDVNVRTVEGDTAILNVLNDQNTDQTKTALALLERGADPNDRDVQYNHTPLILAAWRGRPLVVEELLRRGADPTFRNRWGSTALEMTRDEQVRRLLENL